MIQVILKVTSKFGDEEDNFPFCFATKVSLSKEQGDREKSLKLSGFPDEAVHGWEMTPLRKPLVVSDMCFVSECV